MKTSELIGAQLDWAVAKCETAKCAGSFLDGVVVSPAYLKGYWCPSTNWAQGGPVIERENMSLLPFDDKWEARCKSDIPRTVKFMERRGPTPLIAAMRCYVASKLGDEVEIPEELK